MRRVLVHLCNILYYFSSSPKTAPQRLQVNLRRRLVTRHNTTCSGGLAPDKCHTILRSLVTPKPCQENAPDRTKAPQSLALLTVAIICVGYLLMESTYVTIWIPTNPGSAWILRSGWSTVLSPLLSCRATRVYSPGVCRWIREQNRKPARNKTRR